MTNRRFLGRTATALTGLGAGPGAFSSGFVPCCGVQCTTTVSYRKLQFPSRAQNSGVSGYRYILRKELYGVIKSGSCQWYAVLKTAHSGLPLGIVLRELQKTLTSVAKDADSRIKAPQYFMPV